ncbi:hypothetical protein Syun_023520 [Stephania yunnanensis]|uniref:Uncharacterized protein n=1 Tax=Stephania yunnanensis TaxID=152371 RepID=A0AAP0F9T4_9MAGN
MKFGKELSSQMVPEWQEAYMNYNYLKSLLKDIHKFKQKHKKPATPPPRGMARKMTLYRAFSGLIQRQHSVRSSSSSNGDSGSGDIEDQVILIGAVRREGSGESDQASEQQCYETKFLMSSDEGGEYELVYFRRLDEEFNKVVKFYKAKVEEMMNEAGMLNKQMDALIAFRIKVENPDGSFDWEVEMTRLKSNIASSTAAANAAASPPSAIRKSTRNLEDLGGDDGGDNYNRKPNKRESNRPAPLEILNKVTINNTLETPRSTLKGIINGSNHKNLNYKREDLKKVEEQLMRAFIEFYQKLRLLKSYRYHKLMLQKDKALIIEINLAILYSYLIYYKRKCVTDFQFLGKPISFLNLLAFSKIMKKYDKIAARNASKAYLKMVDNSFLGNSDELTKLIERVEATFIKHFTNGNRSKGVRTLRPKAKRERHRVTYSLGFFSGCTAALILALILIIRTRNIMDHPGSIQYMNNMFPLYSLFGFVVLHILMYGANVFFWRQYRVNYSFIFGFKQGTELGYREIFLLGTVLATLALSCVLSNLDMEMNEKTKDYEAVTELLPLGLVGVTLPDFLLADQLTSQVQALRSLEFYICYYGWGDYKHRRNTCSFSEVYSTFYFIIATIPYWWRFLQCLRRMREERDAVQGYNSLKYFATIVAVCTRTAYSRSNKQAHWKVLAWITSAVAASSSTYWDIVIDWGLLQKSSKNWWLRDKLLIPHKKVYYVAIVLNVLLRFAWLQTVLDFEISSLHREAMISIVASLEIIRRGIWNFFRLENEHLNNVGKYRAFKSVPLPFNYDEDYDKDE